jgi:hypothetical protein
VPDIAGHRLTDTILGLVPTRQALGESRNGLIAGLQSFVAVAGPARREKTQTFFPKLRSIVSPTNSVPCRRISSATSDENSGAMASRATRRGWSALEQALGINDLAPEIIKGNAYSDRSELMNRSAVSVSSMSAASVISSSSRPARSPALRAQKQPSERGSLTS